MNGKIKRRGYLTLAFGKVEYINLAKNLIKSYRIAGNTLPFVLVTDSMDNELDELFDQIVKMTPTKDNNYSEKLNIYDYTPFEETIFIDSDCLVVKNLDFIWALFESYNVNAVASFPERENHFYDSALVKNKYDVDYQPVLNGGIYYFKKNKIAKEIFENAKSFIPVYNDLKMPHLHGKLNEEPLMALAMAQQNIHPIKNKTIMFCTPGQSHFKLDVLRHKCSFLKHGIKVNPAIMHFAMDFTKGFHYTREVQKIILVFDKKYPKWLAWIVVTIKRNPRYIYRIFRMRLREKNFKLFPLMPMLKDKHKLECIK